MADVAPQEIPARADLAWASFPCQDLSLAGAGAGLDGERSGAFWPFWRLMRRLGEDRLGPRLIALENVCGLLSSRGGAIRRLVGAVQARGYRCGALVIDAVEFTPQSRPRLFLLAVAEDMPIPGALLEARPPSWGVSPALLAAHARLDAGRCRAFPLVRLPPPPRRNFDLVDLVEDGPQGVEWQNPDAVARLLSPMAPLHRARLEEATERA